MPNKKPTEAERAARRTADRQRIEQSAQALLSTEGWQRWVSVRARNGLSRYSFANQLLIAFTKPEATFVAGFKAWLDLGYCVRKGEKAIRIFAPIMVKERDPDTDQETGETIVHFKVVSVFDYSQVDPLPSGSPVALHPPQQPISGDSHSHLLEPLTAFAASIQFTVSLEAIAGPAGGWCDAQAKRIVIDAAAPANARVRALIHELTHALGIDYQHYGHQRAEVIVDTVTYIVAASVGMDVGGESIPYIAGWGENGAIEAVSEAAQTIDTLARRIEEAIEPGRDATRSAQNAIHGRSVRTPRSSTARSWCDRSRALRERPA